MRRLAVVEDSVEFLFKTVGGLFILFLLVVVVFLALFWPQGETETPWFGIVGRDLDPQTAQDYRLPFDRGVVVETVYPNSPAYYANIAPGDAVIKFNNRAIVSQDQLRRYILNADPEEKVWMTVYRNGSYYNVALSLGLKPQSRSLPAQAAAARQPANAAPPIPSSSPEGHRYRGVCSNCHVILDAAQAGGANLSAAAPGRIQGQPALTGVPAAQVQPGPQGAVAQLPAPNAPGANPLTPISEFAWAGIAVETLTPGAAAGIGQLSNAAGVVVDEVVLGSQGDRGGVRAGDLIREINGFSIYDAQSFANVVQSQQLGGGVLLVNRNGRPMYVTVPEF